MLINSHWGLNRNFNVQSYLIIKYGEIYHKVFDKILTFLSDKFTLIKFPYQQISTISHLNIKVARVNGRCFFFFSKKLLKKAYSLVIRAMTRVHLLYHPFVFRESVQKLTHFLFLWVKLVFLCSVIRGSCTYILGVHIRGFKWTPWLEKIYLNISYNEEGLDQTIRHL